MNTPLPAGSAPASSPIPTFMLRTGSPIPVLGFGTYKVAPEDTYDAVSRALEVGYRHIDTAQMYGNEAEVGAALEASGIAREDLFITTKVDNSNHEPERAAASIRRSLEDVRTDYVDLLLVHWPLPTLYGGDVALPWPALEDAFNAGGTRAIGLSNFDVAQTQRILDECEVVPTINQVECHPYFPQTELKALLAQHNIALQAWYPLGGRGNDSIMSEPLVQGLAVKHGKSPAQVLLRWHIQQGHIVIPGSKTPSHIAQNIDLFDFALTDEDMAQIDSLDKGKPFFEHNDEVLAGFLAYVPDVDGQK